MCGWHVQRSWFVNFSFADALKAGQKLKVTIASGVHFPAACSPYCVVRLGAQKRKTKLLLRVDREPSWDEAFTLDLVRKFLSHNTLTFLRARVCRRKTACTCA